MEIEVAMLTCSRDKGCAAATLTIIQRNLRLSNFQLKWIIQYLQWYGLDWCLERRYRYQNIRIDKFYVHDISACWRICRTQSWTLAIWYHTRMQHKNNGNKLCQPKMTSTVWSNRSGYQLYNHIYIRIFCDTWNDSNIHMFVLLLLTIIPMRYGRLSVSECAAYLTCTE